MTFNQIREEVEKNGFGLCVITDEEPYLVFSRGIMIAMENAENNSFEEDMAQALAKFISGDFGDFYGWNEYPTKGREYGRYPSCLKEFIHIHREPFFRNPNKEEIVVYFRFER